MALPGNNLSVNGINTEARLSGTRQISVSEHFMNVIEHHSPRDVAWNRMLSKYAAYSINDQQQTGYYGRPVLSYNTTNYWPYAEPYDVFSVDLLMRSWGPVERATRVFFRYDSSFDLRWLITPSDKTHIHDLNIRPGGSITFAGQYSGAKSSSTTRNGIVGIGKINYWPSTPYGPGAELTLTNSIGSWGSSYLNNNN